MGDGQDHYGKILLVDDEPLIRMSTAEILGDLGYTVRDAGSGEAALDIVAGGFTPDWLISDHLMDPMSGPELARRLRALHPDVIVLIISGLPADDDPTGEDFPRLNKPFREADLACMLRKLRRANNA